MDYVADKILPRLLHIISELEADMQIIAHLPGSENFLNETAITRQRVVRIAAEKLFLGEDEAKMILSELHKTFVAVAAKMEEAGI